MQTLLICTALCPAPNHLCFLVLNLNASFRTHQDRLELQWNVCPLEVIGCFTF